jgi:hypothetical protein
MQLAFGSGALWGERTDLGLTSGIGPRQFGVLQDVSIDFDWTNKELYGQYQFPVAIGRGQAKISGKAKFARILGLLYSDLFFGQAAVTGQFGVAEYEMDTIPATTPFQITVANASSYNDDLGVYYATGSQAAGAPFNRVTTPSAAGQYSVNFETGVYTFSSADAGMAVLISYTYNIAASGHEITITNQLMGVMPTWKATFYTQYAGPYGGAPKGTALRLNACTASKLSLPTKIDDWTIEELDFMAFADASGTIGYFSTVE